MRHTANVGIELGAELAPLVRWMIMNQAISGSNLATTTWKTILIVLLDKALYIRVVLDNDHLLALNYDYGMLMDDCCLRVRIHEIKAHKI